MVDQPCINPSEDDLRNMQLHERIRVVTEILNGPKLSFDVLRVIGGWIYVRESGPPMEVFVPEPPKEDVWE